MQIAAKLTIGWADMPRSQFTAIELHNRAIVAPHYDKSLFYQLQTAAAHTHILGLDHLFRRTCGGFDPVAQFVGAIASLPAISTVGEPLVCEIDLFAYTFLAGAYQLDHLLPIARNHDIELAQIQTGCTEALRTLENFEQTGTLPANMEELDAQQYLAIRRIISHPSAKNEWRMLASLLISGPSTASSLERELGIEHQIVEQILHLFESIGIFTRWGEEPGDQANEAVFVIEKVAIPLVLFCLKGTLGIDLLSNLSDLLDTFV